jgi:hypothetical protein
LLTSRFRRFTAWQSAISGLLTLTFLVHGGNEWNPVPNIRELRKAVMSSSSLSNLKAEATALRAHARASGRLLKHCTALEQVAQRHGFENWRACLATLSRSATTGRPSAGGQKVTEIAMKHYQNLEWDFSLDIPERWNKFPPVSSNSPNEVIRFASHEDGMHYCIIFRIPRDPKQAPMAFAENIQDVLSKQKFYNFAISETKPKSGSGLKLDCDRLQENGMWYVREYFVFDEMLIHTVGFGTNRLDDANIDLFERMAQSFSFPGETATV